jgi:heme/copper-type cytochrome/quinol oxidase subunit 3
MVPKKHAHAGPPVPYVDDRRGTFGMALFITTEAMLFVVLFFAYYFLEKGHQRWTVDSPPKLHYALPMLSILLISSAILFWGEQQVKKGRFRSARSALLGTIALGFLFLFFTYLEYSEHLLHLTPTSDAYGSIFFTITSLHGVHLCLGLLMLFWVLLVPQWEPTQYTPYRPYHNAAMYWHFVDIVWVFIIAIVYVGPNVFNAL